LGVRAIAVTNETTTVTANMFSEGYLVVSYGTGIGQSSKDFWSHTTGASGATITYTMKTL